MVLLFYVGDCLMFSPSKDKIDEVYASLQTYFKIEYYGYLKKYLGIDLELPPYGPIHLRHPYLTQRMLTMFPGIEKSGANPTPKVNPPPSKK